MFLFLSFHRGRARDWRESIQREGWELEGKHAEEGVGAGGKAYRGRGGGWRESMDFCAKSSKCDETGNQIHQLDLAAIAQYGTKLC